MRSSRPLRTALLVIVAVAAVAVLEPSVLRSTIRSPRAILTVALAGLVVVVVTRLVRRRWGATAGRATRVALVGAAVLVLLAPALRQTELDEPLPVAAPATTAGSLATSDAPGPTTTSVPTPPPAASAAAATVPAATPERITSGTLVGIGHDATGDVAVHRLADGSHVVRFEGADIKGAPDPVLYLVPGEGRRTRNGGVELGPLRATKGNFNQAVTAAFDFDQPYTVFIWCERYATPIAASDQTR